MCFFCQASGVIRCEGGWREGGGRAHALRARLAPEPCDCAAWSCHRKLGCLIENVRLENNRGFLIRKPIDQPFLLPILCRISTCSFNFLEMLNSDFLASWSLRENEAEKKAETGKRVVTPRMSVSIYNYNSYRLSPSSRN